MDVIRYLKLAEEQYRMLGPEDDRLGRLVDGILSRTQALPEEEMENVIAAAMPFGIRRDQEEK